MLVPLCAVLLLGTEARAQVDDTSGIGLVRVLFTEDGLTVLESSTRPGRLKALRGPAIEQGAVPPGKMLLRVRGADDDAHWVDVIADPLLERHEFVNDEGNLETRFIRRERAEVILRIPASGVLQILTFYRGLHNREGREAPGRGLRQPDWQLEVVL